MCILFHILTMLHFNLMNVIMRCNNYSVFMVTYKHVASLILSFWSSCQLPRDIFATLSLDTVCTLEHELSCLGMTTFVFEHEYFVLEHELDLTRTQTLRARAQTKSSPSTNSSC